MDFQHQTCNYGNWATLLFKVLAWRTDVRTDSHVINSIFEIDELPNLWAPLARRGPRRARAPLFTVDHKLVNNFM